LGQRDLLSLWSQVEALWLIIWWSLETYMVVNFRARAISRGTRKLAWILILIIIIIIKKNILSLKKFKGLYDLCYSLQSRSLFGLLEINCSCFGYNTIFFLILTSLCVWIKTFFFFEFPYHDFDLLIWLMVWFNGQRSSGIDLLSHGIHLNHIR